MNCWLRDPSLYVEYYDGTIKLWKLHENFKAPLHQGPDYRHVKDVTNYLDLVDHSFSWKKSDCDAFKNFLYKYDIMVNCQGEVLSITFPRKRECDNQPVGPSIRFRSLEVVDLSVYGLPVPSIPFREVRYLDSRKSAPVETSSSKENEIKELQEQLEKEKKAEEAYEKRVIDLEIKLKNCRGTLEPWMSYSTVLSDWVSYEELVIKEDFRRPSGRAYTLIETMGDEDNTTNIQPNQFYRALMDGLEFMMELIVVKIENLTPNNEKAKFKPDVWFKFDNAGEIFAAREPTESEKEFNF